MNERRSGTYASVKYDKASCETLNALMKLWNIPSPVQNEHFHTTVIYSRLPIAEDKQCNLDETEMKRKGWKFSPKALKMLDSSSDVKDGTVLVLELHAPQLVKLHNDLVEQGATHDFDDYVPHITLSYDALNFDFSKLVIPEVYFVPNSLRFDPLNAN